MKKYVLFTFVLIYFFSSCTTEKRRYMKGFYFGRHSTMKSEKKKEDAQQINLQANAKEILKKEDLLVLGPTHNPPATPRTLHEANFILMNPGDPCDTIILSNGTTVLGKIIEITKTEIKTQGCESGPPVSRTLLRSTIRQIKYSDGNKEDFIQQPASAKKTKEKKETNGFSAAGFILSIVGYLSIIPTALLLLIYRTDILVIIPGIFGFLAFTFALIGILQIANNDNKYDGLGFSIVAMVLSIPLIASIPFAFTFVPYTSGLFAAFMVGLLLFTFVVIGINYFIKKNKQTDAK